MRNKFVSLILGLMVILIAPAFTTSCVKNAKKDVTEQATVVEPEVEKTVYVQAADWTVSRANRADLMVLTQNETTDLTSSGEVVKEEDSGVSGYLSWQNILIAILAVFSLLFGKLWQRARSTIIEIAKALEDGKVDKAEISRIVNAWKEE